MPSAAKHQPPVGGRLGARRPTLDAAGLPHGLGMVVKGP
jgi:hypothetical protein